MKNGLCVIFIYFCPFQTHFNNKNSSKLLTVLFSCCLNKCDSISKFKPYPCKCTIFSQISISAEHIDSEAEFLRQSSLTYRRIIKRKSGIGFNQPATFRWLLWLSLTFRGIIFLIFFYYSKKPASLSDSFVQLKC